MEYIIVVVEEIHPNYVLGKSWDNTGYKFFTLTEDLFILQQTYKVFIYKDIKVENNVVVISFFGFLNKFVKDFFKFLIGLKGIGTKGALSLFLCSGGSKNLIEALYKNKIEEILKLPKKYTEILLEAISKKKNKDVLSYLASSITNKSVRSEAMWILQEMDYERQKSIDALDLVDLNAKKMGLTNGIENLAIEEVIKEALSILFHSK